MKILLIGNYVHNRQQSMERFAELMRDLLRKAGHEVRLLRPASFFGDLKPGETGLGKWLGYIDRFVLFRPRLRRETAWADVVHICDQANAVYVPVLRGKPHMVTCHDLLAVRSALGEIPSNPTGWSGRIFQRWILSGLRQAQHVVCDSAQTQAELLRVAALPAARSRVVPIALNYPYSPMPPDEARARFRGLGVTECWPYFLHVGGGQWYKNRPGVVRIFQLLATLPAFERHHLVMAGKPWPPELRELAQRSGLAGRMHEWPEVSNEDLRALYSMAEALLFASLAEGFGWPIAEAQACGCPVVTSDRPPMTEVGGAGAVYIDPEDEAAAARTIAEALTRRDALVQAGLHNARRFSQAEMAAGYLDAYQSVLESGQADAAALVHQPDKP